MAQFFRDAKLVFWSFFIGLMAGTGAGGYVVLNADKYNLPFIARGNGNSQTTTVEGANQPGAGNSGNVGDNSGNQAGAGNSGNVGDGNRGGNSGFGDIIAGENAKIDIRISPQDPNFQNDKLPGYFPETGFVAAAPPNLSEFQAATIFTRDLVVQGDVQFSSNNVVIRGKGYTPIFYLQGSNREVRRVAFNLNGRQKGTLLQFGLIDLASGDTNLTYQVNIKVDGTEIWSGRVIYGSPQQLLSVPLNLPNAKTLQIEYIISQGGDNPRLDLVFTRAELLYK